MFAAVRKGRASILLQCAGQANLWLPELSSAYHSCPLARDLIEDCAKSINEELGTPQGLLLAHKFNVLNWIECRGEVPSDNFLASAPISYPMILMTQLANYIKICCHLCLEPQQLCGLLKGATGHSQVNFFSYDRPQICFALVALFSLAHAILSPYAKHQHHTATCSGRNNAGRIETMLCAGPGRSCGDRVLSQCSGVSGTFSEGHQAAVLAGSARASHHSRERSPT